MVVGGADPLHAPTRRRDDAPRYQDLTLELRRIEIAVQQVVDTDPLVIEEIGDEEVIGGGNGRTTPPRPDAALASLSVVLFVANRLKNDESFQCGRSSRLAMRSSNFATSTSNAPAACLSTGWTTSSDGAW